MAHTVLYADPAALTESASERAFRKNPSQRGAGSGEADVYSFPLNPKKKRRPVSSYVKGSFFHCR